MLAVLAARSIPAEEAAFELDRNAAIVAGEALPHAHSRLPVLIVLGSHEDLHFDAYFGGDIGHFGLDMLGVSVARRDALLVGEDHDLEALFVELADLGADFVIEEQPVVGILGELSPALAGDDGVVHVEGGDLGAVLDVGRRPKYAAALSAPAPAGSLIGRFRAAS